MKAAQRARPDRSRRLVQQRGSLLVRIGHAPATVGRLIAFAASRLPLGPQVREGLDLWLYLFDFRLELGADFLELPFRLDPIDRGPLQALLGPTDLRAIAGLD